MNRITKDLKSPSGIYTQGVEVKPGQFACDNLDFSLDAMTNIPTTKAVRDAAEKRRKLKEEGRSFTLSNGKVIIPQR